MNRFVNTALVQSSIAISYAHPHNTRYVNNVWETCAGINNRYLP